VFANIGYISRAPFFGGGVFLQPNSSNIINPDAVNEKIFSMELGYGFYNHLADVRVNAYRTVWADKAMTKGTIVGAGMVLLNMTGVDAKHEGIEMDFAIKPATWLELTGALSLGRWRWQNGATGYFYDTDGRPVKSYSAATGVIEPASSIAASDHACVRVELDGVKVGGSAQTTGSLGAKFKPAKGLYIGVDCLEYARNYADWAFEARDIDLNKEKKYESPWEIPSALLFDLSAGYSFRVAGLGATLSGNIFNLFDKAYIADATDGAGHDAATAYGIFYGFGRTGSLKLKITF
jgi:outer membrane receptor protein involved in Fe transport